jgi:hypothetical protein
MIRFRLILAVGMKFWKELNGMASMRDAFFG